jgi:acyl dehydratase
MDDKILYLEDFSPGQILVSGEHALDEEQLESFARQFDPQPFHLSAASARDTFFGGLVASGWHTAAITMRLLVLSGLPIANGIIGAGSDIRWPKPTLPSDVLSVASEIIDVAPSRSYPDRGTITVRCETRNQRSETVQILVAKLIVFRRSATFEKED